MKGSTALLFHENTGLNPLSSFRSILLYKYRWSESWSDVMGGESYLMGVDPSGGGLYRHKESLPFAGDCFFFVEYRIECDTSVVFQAHYTDDGYFRRGGALRLYGGP